MKVERMVVTREEGRLVRGDGKGSQWVTVRQERVLVLLHSRVTVINTVTYISQ
jgi:hypothetical protein